MGGVELVAPLRQLLLEPRGCRLGFARSCYRLLGSLLFRLDVGGRCREAVAQSRIKVGARVRKRRLPEMLRGLEDGLGHVGRRGKGAGILQASPEPFEPGVQHGADGVGRAAPDALAHPIDGRTRAREQQRVAGGEDIVLGDTACHAEISWIGALLCAIISHDNG